MLGKRQIDVAATEVNTETAQIMIETIEGREILVIVNGTDVNIDIVSKGEIVTTIYTNQTPNATRNEAEFDRSRFSMRTKMTYVRQKQSVNILKPLVFVYR